MYKKDFIMANDARALSTEAINELPNFLGTPETGDKYIIYDASAKQVKTIDALRTRRVIIPTCGNAKVGATAGWVITGSTNRSHATLPASQTAATLVVPITGIPVGATITAVSCTGQVESAGNNVTLTMDVRKITSAAADNVDASLGTDDVGTLTADTVLSSSNLAVTGLAETLAEGECLYVLLTGTTAASTDIDLTGIIVNFKGY